MHESLPPHSWYSIHYTTELLAKQLLYCRDFESQQLQLWLQCFQLALQLTTQFSLSVTHSRASVQRVTPSTDMQNMLIF